MTSFVLVHGAAHAGWCWDRLVPHLADDPRVDHVLAVDLPGHGSRRDGDHERLRIDDYVDAVVADVEDADLCEIVVVGHSLAGLTVGHAAARLGGLMRRLVHLSTCLPEPGTSADDRMSDPRSPLSHGLGLEEMFCNDLDPDTAAWLMSRLEPEPMGPYTEPVTHPDLPVELPVTYVVLERDLALPPDVQRVQAATAGIDDLVTFDSGHEPFLSRPADLARLLLTFA